jgi:tetrahydromethanopterin S-methyltransferase subunit C
MKHKDNGLIKNGYIGFSWTTLFFGPFPALFRGDLLIFVCGLIVMAILGLCTFGIAGIAANIIWAFMYNKYYTRSLIEKGYVFDDIPSFNAEAAAYIGLAQSQQQAE